MLAALAAGVACTSLSPPQITDIQPERGGHGVRSNQEIRVYFDRPMDQASVIARFSIDPRVPGTATWDGASTLVFRHEPLLPDTEYEVAIAAGYRDRTGTSNPLRHHWRFTTEAPPALTSASPSDGSRGFDPSAAIALTFSRPMDAQSIARASTLIPATTLEARQDPTDPRRVLLAPASLLAPQSSYVLSIGTGAVDTDGNHLSPLPRISFTTSPPQPLTHRLTIAAGGDGPGGIWAVGQDGFLRLLSAGGEAFTWSPDGTRLLYRHDGSRWSDYVVGGERTELPFTGDWAAAVPGSDSFAYTSSGTLHVLAGGRDTAVADHVTAAAPAPAARQAAFSVATSTGSELWGVDVDSGARYRLIGEAGSITGIAWSPDGAAIAYRVSAGGADAIRVRRLTGSGEAVTISTGRLRDPAWMPDSQRLVFPALVADPGSGGDQWRALTAGVRGAAAGAAIAISTGAHQALMTAPSPDGRQIAFVDASGDAWVVNLDGSGLSLRAGHDPNAFPYSCLAIAWTRS